MNTINNDSIELMAAFEQRTGVKVSDVIQEGEGLLFIVEEGKLGKAIGKNGSTLLRVREAFKKNVEVIEDSGDVDTFIKKALRGANIRSISKEDNKIAITVDATTRGIAIGKNGANIKKLKVALKRKFGIEDTRIV